MNAERIGSASQARELVGRLIQASEKRNSKNAMIKGMFDGNPPYDQAKLRAAGQSYRANFSTLEGKGLLSSSLVPYYDLIATVFPYVQVRTRFGGANSVEVERQINHAVDSQVRQWADFEQTLWSMLHDFVAFGKGFLAWELNGDWRPRYVPFHRVLVPDDTTTVLDELEIFVVRRKLAPHRLWGFLDSGTGWRQDAVLRSLEAAKGAVSTNTQDSFDVQRALRDHDLFTDTKMGKVEAAYVYTRSRDGFWNLHVVDENDTKGNSYLFVKENITQWVGDLISPFFFEVLDGSWNGVSALGKDIFPIMKYKDRFRCGQVDAVGLRNSIVIQPKLAGALTESAIVQNGALTVINENFNVLQSSILGDITSTIAVNRDLDQMLSVNTGIYRTRLEQTSGNPRTAEEVRLQFANSTVLTTSATNRFLVQADRMWTVLVRRMLNDPEGEVWRDLEDVPVEAVNGIHRVMATRAVGNGSQVMRQQVLQSLAPYVGSFPEGGRRHFLEDAVATIATPEKIDRYLPPRELEALPTRQNWEAMVENDSFKDGTQMPVTDDHDHVVHLQSHLLAASQAVNSLEKGAEPAEILQYLDAAGPHMQLHINSLGQDAFLKESVQALEGQLKELAGIADKLRKLVEQRAQKAVEDQKVQSGEAATVASKMELERQQALQKMELERLRVMNDVQLRRAQAAAQIEQDRAVK